MRLTANKLHKLPNILLNILLIHTVFALLYYKLQGSSRSHYVCIDFLQQLKHSFTVTVLMSISHWKCLCAYAECQDPG